MVPPVTQAPNQPQPQAPQPVATTTTASHIVVETRTKKILDEYNASSKIKVNSLTKIANAVVALDWQKVANVNLNYQITIPPNASSLSQGYNPLQLYPGDKISLRDALYASLMTNDPVTPHSISAFVGHDLLVRKGAKGDPTVQFVKQMNGLASKLGMKRTKFYNAHGRSNITKSNYSTTADLAKLALYANTKPSLKFQSSQRTRTIKIKRKGSTISKKIYNQNSMLGQRGIDGIHLANGTSSLMLTVAKDAIIDERNSQTRVTPRGLVVVMVNTPNHKSRAKQLIQNSWQKYNQWFSQGLVIYDRNQVLTNR